MDEPRVVDGGEHVGEVDAEVDDLFFGQRAEGQPLGERLAADELGDEVRNVSGLADLEHARQARMADARERERFAVHPAGPPTGVARHLHHARRRAVPAAIHDRMHAVPELRLDGDPWDFYVC